MRIASRSDPISENIWIGMIDLTYAPSLAVKEDRDLSPLQT